MGDIGKIIKAFFELLKLLRENREETFKKAWAEDEAKFIEAWKAGKVDVLNALFDKYYRLLDILTK